MDLKDLAVNHDYYASASNFYSNEVSGYFSTWADFYEEFCDADIDLNLVYRWDICRRDKSNHYYMQIIIIVQRKGIYMPIHVDYVDDKDVPQIIEFMKPHFEKLCRIWNPLSELFLTQLSKTKNEK